jgi:hypothetical protein
MSVQSTIVLALVAWLVVYITIYYVLYTTTPPKAQLSVQSSNSESEIASSSTSRKTGRLGVMGSEMFPVLADPFVSTYCQQLSNSFIPIKFMATVIIDAKPNPLQKHDLLQTVPDFLH